MISEPCPVCERPRLRPHCYVADCEWLVCVACRAEGKDMTYDREKRRVVVFGGKRAR